MEQYIPKSVLLAKIERWIELLTNEKNQEGISLIDKLCLGGRIAELQEVKTFIDTLNVKEIDFEKELDRIWFDNKFGELFDNSAVDYVNVKEICKYFFELGMSVGNKAQKGEEV